MPRRDPHPQSDVSLWAQPQRQVDLPAGLRAIVDLATPARSHFTSSPRTSSPAPTSPTASASTSPPTSAAVRSPTCRSSRCSRARTTSAPIRSTALSSPSRNAALFAFSANEIPAVSEGSDVTSSGSSCSTSRAASRAPRTLRSRPASSPSSPASRPSRAKAAQRFIGNGYQYAAASTPTPKLSRPSSDAAAIGSATSSRPVLSQHQPSGHAPTSSPSSSSGLRTRAAPQGRNKFFDRVRDCGSASSNAGWRLVVRGHLGPEKRDQEPASSSLSTPGSALIDTFGSSFPSPWG